MTTPKKYKISRGAEKCITAYEGQQTDEDVFAQRGTSWDDIAMYPVEVHFDMPQNYFGGTAPENLNGKPSGAFHRYLFPEVPLIILISWSDFN